MSTREFTRSRGLTPRTIDNAAPSALRLEWISAVFGLADEGHSNSTNLYQMINGTLGISDSVKPYGGHAHRAGENLCRAEWERFYDVVLRIYREFSRCGAASKYIAVTNDVLAAHGIVWHLSDGGGLERILPTDVHVNVVAAFEELAEPKYKAACELFLLAKEAFDARPRRERDAGANAFDGLESVIKIRFGDHGTFGQVLDKRKGALNKEVFEVLRKIEVVRHNHLGHGTAAPFSLSSGEVDLIYVSCLMAARLIVRLP